MSTQKTLHEFYDEYERIEEAFQQELDESLHPRGSDMLYDIVGDFELRPGATIVDLGSGNGQHTIRLAQRLPTAKVVGIEPVPLHIEMSAAKLADAAGADPSLHTRVSFKVGTAESIPVPDRSVDLIWCREMLYHVDLPGALAECRRALKADGRMLIYYHVSGERLEPNEAAWFWAEGLTDIVVDNMDGWSVESAFAAADFRVVERLDLGSEFGERLQEDSGEPARRLLHAARLLRAPERYKAQFGENAYRIMLGDCFWHIYRMIGKLSSRIYVLALE